MKRLKRSDFIDDGGEQIGFGLIVEGIREIAQRAGGAKDGRQWRLEVMGDRGQQSRAQLIGFCDTLHAIDVLHEMDALDRQRALIGEGLQKPALLGAQQSAGLVAADAEDADGTAARAHGQEQPLRPRQRVGVAASGTILLPGPLGSRQIGLFERILRRVAGLEGNGAALGQQQHHAHFQHRGDLISGRPQNVIERTGARQFAAEGVERFNGANALVRGDRVRAAARGEVGYDDRQRR